MCVCVVMLVVAVVSVVCDGLCSWLILAVLLHMCTLVHQQYADLSQHLLQEVDKQFQGGIDKSVVS